MASMLPTPEEVRYAHLLGVIMVITPANELYLMGVDDKGILLHIVC